MIYMGAGTERGQKRAMEGLLPHRDALLAAVDRGPWSSSPETPWKLWARP